MLHSIIIRVFIILMICSYGQPASPQSRYNFYTMSTADGLSNDDIWAINQDKYGFMWIGTASGLNRYDGHTIKQYFHNPTDKQSIAGNVVYWIYRDSDGDMWFACGAGGLSRYNYAKDNFESLAPYDSARKFNPYNGPVWRFGEDNEKRIYLSSGEACYRYDKRTGKFEELTSLFNKQLAGGIGRFLMDKNNIMWIAADNGLFRFDITKNQIKKISYDEEKLAYGRPGIYDIEFINDHEIMGAVERAGYLVINTKTLELQPAEDAYNPAISKRFTQTGEIIKDSHGRMWMANSADGLLEYSTTQRTSYSLKQELRYPYPYAEQEGNGKSIFEDRDGNIWYGTSTKGLVWFQPQQTFLTIYQRNFATTNSLPNNYVSSFLQLTNNEMFIGTDRGITKMNIDKKSFGALPGIHQRKRKLPLRFHTRNDQVGRYIVYHYCQRAFVI